MNFNMKNEFNNKQKTSNFKSGANFAKFVLGNALLYNPEIFSKNGIFGGIALIVILGGILSHLSLYLLFRVSFVHREKNYENLIGKSINKKMKPIIKTFVLILCIFSIFTYVDFIEVIFQKMKFSPKESRWITCISFLIVNLIFTRYSQLYFVNLIGLFAVFFFCLITGLKCIQNWDLSQIATIKINSGIVDSISRISLSFCYHYCILPFTDGIYNQNDVCLKKNILFSTFYAALISTCVNLFVGATGYIAYPDSKPLWFENINSHDFFVFYLLLIMSFLITLLSVPICFIGIMQEMDCFFKSKSAYKKIFAMLLTTCMVFVGQAVAKNTIAKCFIALITTLIMFLFPSFSYLNTFKKPLREQKIPIICILLGSCLFLKIFYDLIVNLISLF
ncbi:hypothetical protein NUSPORA_01347 [Nucleospora cyclopteri]